MKTGYLPPLIKEGLTPVEYLAINGYFDGDFPDASLSESDPKFQRAAKRYQNLTELKPDGVFGPVSAAKTQEKRCALPDLDRGFVKNAKGEWEEWKLPACLQKWSVPGNKLTCSHENMKFSSLSASETDTRWWAAFKSWMAVCGIVFERVPWNGPGKSNFWHRALPIDGGASVLAYHYLPGCGLGITGSLEGRFDTAENWNGQYFQGVCAHEIGHGKGLEHDTSSAALMYPYARQSIYLPQPLDIERAVTRYGKPTTPTDPPINPPMSLEERVLQLETQDSIFRVKVKMMEQEIQKLWDELQKAKRGV